MWEGVAETHWQGNDPFFAKLKVYHLRNAIYGILIGRMVVKTLRAKKFVSKNCKKILQEKDNIMQQ